MAASDLAIGDTSLLAVEAAPSAAAAVAVVLAGAAVRGEALARTRQLLIVAGALLFAHQRGRKRAASGVAASGTAEPASVPAATAHPGYEPGYVEPSGPEEPGKLIAAIPTGSPGGLGVVEGIFDLWPNC